MNNWDRFLRAAKNPRLFARGLNRLYHRRAGRRVNNSGGVDVFAEDWDTLVVLDACRYDMFESTSQLPGTLSSRISKGSSTVEWLQANFDGRDLSDTVYVTANPQLERHRESWDVNFHEVINVWLDEGWDERTGTVLADTMTEAAITAHEQFPQKRVVVHYMQPHYPFVPSDTEFDKDHLASIESGKDDATGENVWSQKFMGKIDQTQEEMWNMYAENLEYVLEYVENLIEKISGKTVITSDHGNYVGERASPIPIREYGHPRGLYNKHLICVPWLVVDQGIRRDIKEDETGDENTNIDTTKVTERLKDLGYKE